MEQQTSAIDSNYKLLTYSNGVQYIVYNSASWLVGADDRTGTDLKERFFPAESNGYIAEAKLPNLLHLTDGEIITIKGDTWETSRKAIVRRIYKNGNVTVSLFAPKENIKLTRKNFYDFEITAPRWFSNVA